MFSRLRAKSIEKIIGELAIKVLDDRLVLLKKGKSKNEGENHLELVQLILALIIDLNISTASLSR